MRIAAFMVAVAVLAGCAAPSGTVSSDSSGMSTDSAGLASSVSRSELVSANNGFAHRFLQDLVAAEEGKNVFTSPLSVSTALAMAYEGADGATRDAMRTTLGFPNVEPAAFEQAYRQYLGEVFAAQPGVALEFGNALWVDEAFEPYLKDDYVSGVEHGFSGEVETRDFADAATVADVNGWAAEKTHGKVPKVIDEIAADEVLLIMNAVYFKGDWEAQFNATCTHKAPFTLSDGKQVPVDMMCGQNLANMTYARNEDFTGARFSYTGQGVAMFALMPDNGDVEALLRSQSLESMFGQVVSRGAAAVELPKFSLKTHLNLGDSLSRLGMGLAFSDGADFSRMSETPLKVSRVLHDAIIEVDEKGTVAAAVTTVGMTPTCVDCGPPRIVFDRPFLVVLRHEATGAILFAGVVADPTSS